MIIIENVNVLQGVIVRDLEFTHCTDASQLTWPDIQLTDNDSRADCQKVIHFEQQIEQKVLFTAQHSIKSPWANELCKSSLMNVIKQMSWAQTVFQDISNNPWCSSLRRFVCRVLQASNYNNSNLRLNEHFQSRENDPWLWCLVITIHFVFNIDFKLCLAGSLCTDVPLPSEGRGTSVHGLLARKKTILNRVNVRKWLGFLYGLWSTWWAKITGIYVVVQDSLFFLKCTSFIHSLLLQSCEHWHAEKCRACPFSLNSDHIDRESFLVKKESKRQS